VIRNAWGRALAEICTAADIPVAEIARETDFSGPRIFQYIKHTRTPKTKDALKINKAVGHLVGEQDVATYLDSIYWLERSEKPELTWPTIAAAGPTFAMETIDYLTSTYVRPGAGRDFCEALFGNLPYQRTWKTLLSLYRMRRRRLLRRILGEGSPGKSQFDETREILKRHGFDIEPWLKPREELEQLLREDQLTAEFTNAVRTALRSIDDPVERLAAERTIMHAFDAFARPCTGRELKRTTKKGHT